MLRFHSCQLFTGERDHEDTHPLSAAATRSPFALANADVVMLVGARLNWLLAHGKKGWAADTQFIQLDIEPQEIDSNRPIAGQSLVILHPVCKVCWQN